MTVGALGNLHFLAITNFKHVVLKRRVALAAGSVDSHSAFFTFVGSHIIPSACF
jgi:hypothetical protein